MPRCLHPPRTSACGAVAAVLPRENLCPKHLELNYGILPLMPQRGLWGCLLEKLQEREGGLRDGDRNPMKYEAAMLDPSKRKCKDPRWHGTTWVKEACPSGGFPNLPFWATNKKPKTYVFA